MTWLVLQARLHNDSNINKNFNIEEYCEINMNVNMDSIGLRQAPIRMREISLGHRMSLMSHTLGK
ncbi:hypothetical protein BLOT_009022 [Blomia tropicalis]|nr:hypothetical protein BLOT_009022 [Blomia tropicalis]